MKINIQPIEKQNLGVRDELQIHSVFYTIQGEGPFTGRPAVFVRLAGCNLQCPGCDTDYTSRRTTFTTHALVEFIEHQHRYSHHKPIVVITGGEPFRQNIAPLVRTLCSHHGYKVQIETNGTLFIEDMPWDSITVICSPKAGKINPRLLPHIDAYKYVMAANSIDPIDGLPTLALDHTASPRVARPPANDWHPVYLQPMDVGDEVLNKENVEACIASCMRHGYIMQLQTHKIMGLE